MSANFFTPLILIIFPACYALFSLLTEFGIPFIENSYLSIPAPIPIVVPPIPLFTVLLIFAIYPTIYPTPIFFKKRGFENVVIEYQHIKKILVFTTIIIIILLSIYVISVNKINSILVNDKEFNNLIQQLRNQSAKLYETENSLDSLQFTKLNETENTLDSLNPEIKVIKDEINLLINQRYPFIISIQQGIRPILDSIYFILPIPISVIVKLLIEHSRRLFKLYFAKAYFGIVLKKFSDEIDMAKYLMMGLRWYNKLLKQTINLEINNIDTICEKLLTKSPLDNNKDLISLAKSFEQKEGLEPLRHISTNFHDSKAEKILTNESLRIKIQESSDLIIPIVTIIITIITTFFFTPLNK